MSVRRSALPGPAIEDVGAEDVLSPAVDRGSLVQFPVDEHQRLTADRLDAEVGTFGAEVEVRFAAVEVVVEVDHEGQLALLRLAASEGAVVMGGEALADVVAVVPPALVEIDQL